MVLLPLQRRYDFNVVGLGEHVDRLHLQQAIATLVDLVPCTACRYCQPCPNNVEIPRVFQIYNDATMYDDFRGGRFMYNGDFGIKKDQRADLCTECGECLEKCPQHIEIPDWLKKAHAALYLEHPPMPPGMPPRPPAPVKKE